MGLLDSIFDFDGDGKTGLFDAFVAVEGFRLFNEYCDLKEKQKQNRTEFDRLSGRNQNFITEKKEEKK